MLQTSDFPLNELVRRPDDQRAEQIEGGVHKGSNEREGGGRHGGNNFGDEEDDVGYDVDLYGFSRKLCKGLSRTTIH